jgi:murein DD-endopeptidase MepM/ murein hydrolase activator NlpD
MRIMKVASVALIAAMLPIGCVDQDVAAPESSVDWPTDLTVPIRAATFSLSRAHLPGAIRRDGGAVHEGFDFVDAVVGRPLAADESVVAVAPGTVVRADTTFDALNGPALAFLGDRSEGHGAIAAYAKDRLRGRQVWIEHEDGFVSRYAHLSAVEAELRPGRSVEAGDVLGRIGNTGVLPTEAQPDPPRHLHFELRSPDGHYLGQELSPLEVHAEIARIFGEAALPRHARDAVAALRAGEPPMDYPPEPLPETGFNVDLPSELGVGDALAVAVTWQGNAFTTADLFASLDGARLGFVDAGNGAWLLLPAPNSAQTIEATLLVGGIDRYGRSLIGRQSLRFAAREQPAPPVEVSPEAYQRLNDSQTVRAESRVLARATAASLQIREPLWKQPFRSPAEGRLVRDFGQQIVSGPFRPASASPGFVIRTDGQRAVVASNAGRVALAETLPQRGLTVAVVHGGGLITVYAGLDTVAAAVGQQLERGQTLGSVGSDEESGQLRFEIHLGGIPVDPRNWLDRRLPPRSE